MDPSINRPAGTGVTAVTEEKGGNRDQMRGPIMSVCVREESGVGVACQEVSVHTDLIGLSVSPCLLALPHNSFLLRGPIGGELSRSGQRL